MNSFYLAVRWRPAIFALAALTTILQLSGCGGGGGGSKTPATLSSIAITPANPSVALGATQQLTATGSYSDGSKNDLTSSATWSSSSSGVATVSSAGLAMPVTTGTSTITATVGSIHGSTTLTVPAPTLVSLAVSPATATVAAGLTQQFTVSATYSDGSKSTPTGVTWSSSDFYEADINSSGIATGNHLGTVTITAAVGSMQATAQLTVTAPVLTGITVSPLTGGDVLGITVYYNAKGTYSDLSTAIITSQVTWSLSNNYVASITPAGALTGKSVGLTTVTATLDKISGSAAATVYAWPRYLMEASDAGRELSRLVINGTTGQPRHWGYQPTGITTNPGFTCITADPSQSFAYLTSLVEETPGTYSGSITSYSIDATTGTLTALGSPVSIPEPIGCIHFTPGGTIAYALPNISEQAQQIVTLEKSSTGAISVLGTTALPDNIGSLAIDPLGQYLYVATEQLVANAQASLYGYSIDPTSGALTAIPGMPTALPTNTFGQLSFHPSGGYLYLSDSNGTNITGYSINRSTGVLTAGAASVAPCINPQALQFTPDGTQAFVACGESIGRSAVSSNLISFTVGSSGGLSQSGQADAYLSPTGLTVSPSGKFLYLISSGSHYIQNGPGSYTGGYNAIVTYAVNTDNTITEISQTNSRFDESSLLLLAGAAPVTISDAWNFRAEYIPAGGGTAASSQIAFDQLATTPQSSGEIGPVLDHPFSMATLPWQSDILFASSKSAPNLQAVTLNPATGNTTIGTSFGNGTKPGGVVIDPSGTVAFATEPATGKVYWYGQAGMPGYWSSLETAPGVPAYFTAEAGAGPIAIDSAGRYLFVGNQTTSSISEFQYAGAAPVPSTPLPASPIAIAVDPNNNALFVVGKDNLLRMLQIDVNGGLTDVVSVELSGTPNALAIEPSGHFLYVGTSAGIEAFGYDTKAESLSNLSVYFPPLAQVTALACDPTGTLLWVEGTNLPPDGTAYFALQIGSDGKLSGTIPTTAQAPQVSSFGFWATAQ